MAINELNGKVRVYNYELSPVGFPSQHNNSGIFIRGRDEDEEFIVERVALDDIESENTKSDLFKIGRIRFHKDEEDEIYKRLGIEDRDNIKSDTELMEFLSDGSIEKVKLISSLKSSTLILRMKSILFNMERNGNIPPHTISSVVVERANELKYGGKRNKDSEINKILEKDKQKNEDNKAKAAYSELAKKVEKLEKESEEKDKTISDSKNAITDLLAMVEGLKNENKSNSKTETKTEAPKTEIKTEAPTKKKPGRPPRKTS